MEAVCNGGGGGVVHSEVSRGSVSFSGSNQLNSSIYARVRVLIKGNVYPSWRVILLTP